MSSDLRTFGEKKRHRCQCCTLRTHQVWLLGLVKSIEVVEKAEVQQKGVDFAQVGPETNAPFSGTRTAPKSKFSWLWFPVLSLRLVVQICARSFYGTTNRCIDILCATARLTLTVSNTILPVGSGGGWVPRAECRERPGTETKVPVPLHQQGFPNVESG